MKITIDPLDSLFSEYIRRRAISRIHGCERCGSYQRTYKTLQCSHYHKRRKLSTRWDERNCNGFCFGCHQYFEENREEYKQWLFYHLGEREFNMLEGRVRCTYPKPDKKVMELYIKAQLKLLRDGDAD